MGFGNKAGAVRYAGVLGGEEIDRHGLNWVCKTRGTHVDARDWKECIPT